MRFVKKKSQNWNFGAKKTLKANNFNFVLVRLLDKNRGTKSTLMLIDELWDIGEHFLLLQDCKFDRNRSAGQMQTGEYGISMLFVENEQTCQIAEPHHI